MSTSKRKLESYRRAELVCRELRFQVGGRHCDMNLNDAMDFLVDWLEVTGKIGFERPANNTKNKKKMDKLRLIVGEGDI